MPADPMPDKDVQLMAAKLDLITEKVAALKPADKKESQPWYTVIAGVLGVPALVLVMALNFSTYRSNAYSNEEKVKETEKTQLEINQLRAKSTELTDVAKSQDIQSLKRAIQDAVPLLQQSAVRLETQAQTPVPAAQPTIILRYIAVWAFLSFVSAVFSVFYTGWDLVGQLPYTISNWIRLRMRDRERQMEDQLRVRFRDGHDWESQRKESADLYAASERRRNRLDMWTSWASTVIRTLPRLFQAALQVAIFTAVIVPMFDYSAAELGSRVRFQDVLASAKRLEVGKCLSYVHDLVAPAAGGAILTTSASGCDSA